MDVEVFSDDSGTQSRRKIVVPNHDIAVAHIDCNRNNSLVHDIPLMSFIISLSNVPASNLNPGKATYSCDEAVVELALDQSGKNSTITDQYVFREQREIRVDEAPPYGWLVGFVAKGGQNVVHQTFLGRVGVIEEGRSQATIKGFINSNEILRCRVVDKTSCDVRQVLIPVALLI